MAAEQGLQWQLSHLMRWLGVFELQVPHSRASDLSDGAVIANVLHMIDPSWFDETWLSRIRQNVGDNKLIKVSNLKKVLDCLLDYYELKLNRHLKGFLTPDVNKIGYNDDESNLCRLLQLVLGCAVQCESQEQFIQAIRMLDEDLQNAIKAAIEHLFQYQELDGDSLAPGVQLGFSTNQVVGLDYQDIINQKDEKIMLLTSTCQNLVSQKTHLEDEVQHLQTEIETLRSGGGLESMVKEGNSTEVALLKREMLRLTDELVRSDAVKEDYRIRTEALEKERDRLWKRQDELQNAVDKTRSLKDEIDILRERSARLEMAESAMDAMRRKVEEINDLKRQFRQLEENNAQYIQRNMELEEELKRQTPWKTQFEAQKKEMSEMRMTLDDERKRGDRFEFDLKKLHEKHEALAQEKERLLGERNNLKEEYEELRFAQLNQSNMTVEGSPSAAGVDTLDMIPYDFREKLRRLEHENRLLRSQQEERERSGHGDQAQVLQTIIDGLKERIEQLEAENRKSNQRVLELDSQLQELRSPDGLKSQSTRTSTPSEAEYLELKEALSLLKIRWISCDRDLQKKNCEVDQLNDKCKEQEAKMKEARDALQRKDDEMAKMEERYKKYIEKAKMVLKTIDPKQGGANSSPHEVAALQAQLREKDRLIESLERETERHRLLKDAEDQLMTTAFYNLSMQLQRQAMEQRLGSNCIQGAAAATATQGFLTRQRQTSMRGRSSTINQGENYN